ncbi:MAG: hypothetical protein ACOC1I_05650 [Spirochaetota bacterium]
MEGDRPFSEQLAQAVEQRRATIETDELPKLKELYRVFHSSFQGLHQLLIRKGLVQQDPYKGEQKLSDITPPTDDPYLESERDLAVGIRMDAYDNTLEFLNNYFEFRIDALGFRELKQLSDLVRYITWDQLSASSPRPTTRGVADLVSRARGGQDSFANSVISDALEQLAQKSKAIVDQIKTIGTFKREEYKLTLREQLLPVLEHPDQLVPEDPDSLDRMRRKHKEIGIPAPFVPELASETLAEEYGPEADRRRAEVLERLHATKKPQKKARPKESLRDVLIGAIRGLASASRPFEAIADHLLANAEVVQTQAKSFGQRFREWIDKLTNRKPAKTTYEVEYTDESTGAVHTEPVVFDDFIASLTKKSRLYASFLARSGSPWTKLQKATDEQLYQYINRELGECHTIQRRAAALDTHLKSLVPAPERRRMKGVKIELSHIRNAVANSNQLKHEYVAKKEEHEQLRKLGIDV